MKLRLQGFKRCIVRATFLPWSGFDCPSDGFIRDEQMAVKAILTFQSCLNYHQDMFKQTDVDKFLITFCSHLTFRTILFCLFFTNALGPNFANVIISSSLYGTYSVEVRYSPGTVLRWKGNLNLIFCNLNWNSKYKLVF